MKTRDPGSGLLDSFERQQKKIRRRLRVATGPSVGRRASIDNLSDSSITRFFPSPFQLRLIKIHYEKTRAKGHNEWERFFLFDFFFLVNQDTIIDNPFEPLITRRFVSLLHFFRLFIWGRTEGGSGPPSTRMKETRERDWTWIKRERKTPWALASPNPFWMTREMSVMNVLLAY